MQSIENAKEKKIILMKKQSLPINLSHTVGVSLTRTQSSPLKKAAHRALIFFLCINAFFFFSFLGAMKGVIPTLDIAKIFHPTPDIKAKKCPRPTLKNQVDTRHCDFQVDTRNCKIFDLDTDPPYQGPYFC